MGAESAGAAVAREKKEDRSRKETGRGRGYQTREKKTRFLLREGVARVNGEPTSEGSFLEN